MSSIDYVIHDDYNVKGFLHKYRYLSNFHLADVYFEGIKYQSTEHAYQAAKTLDTSTRSILFLNVTAAQAKKNGKILTNIRTDWHHIKYDVMSVIVFDKFYRHPDLRADLLSTGRRHLEETNSWNDRFWGVCNGKGDNNLGKILMGIRTFWSTKYPELYGAQKPTSNPLF